MSGQDRVLVVDDDPEIRDMLFSTLGFAGFEVTTAADAATALNLTREARPDVVVVDVMMPGADGFDFVRFLRAHDATLPVLFLTARDAIEDRVRGLKLGADDYVTKPFSISEVAARVEALVRRSRAIEDAASPVVVETEPLACADLVVDDERHVVTRAGAAIDLSPTEYRLLAFLLRNGGRVVSKSQILDHVWHYDFGGDTNVVERFISNLRKKIDGTGPALLHTVRGFGYTIREPDQ
jgi:two-component system OmpR family response regulator